MATLRGPSLIVAMDALATRRDAACVDALKTHMADADPSVSRASVRALARIANRPAIDCVQAWGASQAVPWSADVAGCLVQVAYALMRDGEPAAARAIFEQLAQPQQSSGTRRAACEGLLALPSTEREAMVVNWFVSGDRQQREVAAQHVGTLPDETLRTLTQRMAELTDSGASLVIEVLAERHQQDSLPLVMQMLQSDSASLRLVGIRCLGNLRDAAAVPTLIDLLSDDPQVAAAAQLALVRLPREVVGPALLAALERTERRVPAIEVLREMKYYEAIDPLVALAASSDRAVYEPVLAGLAGIADPDEADLPRLFALLTRTPLGAQRDEVEKTIAHVCQKLPAEQNPTAPVLGWWQEQSAERAVLSLPLLGRLGGAEALDAITQQLGSADPATVDAAVRGLCNWPNAEVAERLSHLALGAGETASSPSASAYVRMVSLPSDRAPAETLTMLQTAMRQAEESEDRALVLERAASVRTMECFRWLAGFLDDPQCAQAACQSLVELAHHRELRHPNLAEVRPVLEKVVTTSRDPQMVERAKRYQLGL